MTAANFCIVFFGIMVFISLLLIIRQIRITMLFKNGHNPYVRICRKCGATQNQYQTNYENDIDPLIWWEEVYPIGNDENCPCHKYAEYHN
jgi:hypothetical protein